MWRSIYSGCRVGCKLSLQVLIHHLDVCWICGTSCLQNSCRRSVSGSEPFNSEVLALHFCSDPNRTGGVFTSRFTLTRLELELLRFGWGGEDIKKDVWDVFLGFFFFCFLEGSCTNAGTGCGWDEEITKQTGGFYERKQNLLTRAKQKQKLQRGGQKRGGG